MYWIVGRLLSSWILTLGLLVVVSLPLASAEERALTRIAFGSCADQHHPQPIWDKVLAYDPELFIFAGDNVYGDDRSGTLIELRVAYARAAKIEVTNRLRATRLVLATWDDHDFGMNDAGRDFPNKRASQDLFLTYWGVPEDDPRHQRDGVYNEATFGPVGQRVQVILLDTRFFRSPLKATDDRNVPGKEHYKSQESQNSKISHYGYSSLRVGKHIACCAKSSTSSTNCDRSPFSKPIRDPMPKRATMISL
ncbi:MAG: alkaline phosphatase D family protein [Geminicoccaceae bacterium]